MSEPELIATFDADGRPAGAVLRADAYRTGARIGLVFVWIAWCAGDGRVLTLLQSRARPDDRYRGALDAPAGGHIRAGETEEEAAVRELLEEVGVRAAMRELVRVDQSTLELLLAGDLSLRAIQTSFLWPRAVALEQASFSDEIDALVEADLADLRALLAGTRAHILGRERRADAPAAICRIAITAAAFAAYPPEVHAIIARSLEVAERTVRDAASKVGARKTSP
jgi:8-oxo-dGTP pyrophosphatase MutT (NUDIX family)